MQPVKIYTRPMCPYCVRAIALLTKKGVKIDEVMAAFDGGARKEMLARSNGKRTYPQIFIGDRHVGGYDDLAELDRAGELDRLLNG